VKELNEEGDIHILISLSAMHQVRNRSSVYETMSGEGKRASKSTNETVKEGNIHVISSSICPRHRDLSVASTFARHFLVGGINMETGEESSSKNHPMVYTFVALAFIQENPHTFLCEYPC
jgi:hypothetical protein